MATRIITLAVLTCWLAIIGFGLNNYIPSTLIALFAVLWVVTLLGLIRWRAHLRFSASVKALSFCLIALMVLASAAIAYETFKAIAPVASARYQIIALILADSMVASTVSTLTVSFLIAVVFHKNSHLVLVLGATMPISAIQIMDALIADANLTSYVLVAFEIGFRILTIWIGSIIASEALTTRSTRRQAAAAAFRG